MEASTTATLVLHPANERGHADHGWLNAWHSFSFASWFDPRRIQFGALRVLNDDTIAPGRGFGQHPHDNMEIITLVTEGALEHRDSMGNQGVIRAGDVQVMSAGTGVTHSEMNADPASPTKLFQIWIFPRERGTKPRYDQVSLREADRLNTFQQIVSPGPAGATGLWIGQDAWLHLGKFSGGHAGRYTLQRPGNGVYAMVVSGSATVAGQPLGSRAAAGIRHTAAFDVQAGPEGAELLLIEVPMAHA